MALLKEKFRTHFKGIWSLKAALAIYFIPITVIPALFLSFYATRLFEESFRDTLDRRASSERDAIVAEMETLDADLLAGLRRHGQSSELITAVASGNATVIESAISGYRSQLTVRIYSPSGKFITGRKGSNTDNIIPYISHEGMERVRSRGETFDRYFSSDTRGFVTVMRILLKSKTRFVGILEEQFHYGSNALAELKNRRGVDAIFLSRDFNTVSATFALSDDIVRTFSSAAFKGSYLSGQAPIQLSLGNDRYSAYLFDFPAPFSKPKKWAYLAIFLSLNAVDQRISQLKIALIYLTIVLILIATLLIFVFSNRLTRPIELLVSAMKRMKLGATEPIPTLDSTYELEYLVRSFNEMASNVDQAKKTLEIKLEELREANNEIRNTQSKLVQSAKMVSLGQIVAGVAHELNNPIAFISSNMHHLSDYVKRLESLLARLRSLYDTLPEKDRAAIEKLEKDLEIDFVLKDMEDITRSCVEGANRTKDIVLGLRTFSRTEDASFRLVDLHEGIQSTLKLLSPELKGKVTVHSEFKLDRQVECNLSQMNQVFMNLLSNAAHAIDKKGEIWIRTRREGDFAVIEIEDNGCGIAKADLEMIFDPFFTTKKVGQGTGLGLSIAYGLIQRHQGTIDVESVVDEGTQFTIRLPLKQSIAA